MQGSLEGREPIEFVVPALRGLGEPVLQMSSVLQDNTLAPGTVGLELSTSWSLMATAAGWCKACGLGEFSCRGPCLDKRGGCCGVMYMGMCSATIMPLALQGPLVSRFEGAARVAQATVLREVLGQS